MAAMTVNWTQRMMNLVVNQRIPAGCHADRRVQRKGGGGRPERTAKIPPQGAGHDRKHEVDEERARRPLGEHQERDDDQIDRVHGQAPRPRESHGCPDQSEHDHTAQEVGRQQLVNGRRRGRIEPDGASPRPRRAPGARWQWPARDARAGGTQDGRDSSAVTFSILRQQYPQSPGRPTLVVCEPRRSRTFICHIGYFTHVREGCAATISACDIYLCRNSLSERLTSRSRCVSRRGTEFDGASLSAAFADAQQRL